MSLQQFFFGSAHILVAKKLVIGILPSPQPHFQASHFTPKTYSRVENDLPEMRSDEPWNDFPQKNFLGEIIWWKIKFI